MDEQTPLFGITSEEWANTPVSVQAAFGTLLDLIKELSAKVCTLEAQVAQTSRTSSNPPSSDPPATPPAPPRPSRGKRGAKEGHPNHQRALLPPEQVDEFVLLHPQCCPDCHCSLPIFLTRKNPSVFNSLNLCRVSFTSLNTSAAWWTAPTVVNYLSPLNLKAYLLACVVHA